MILKFKRLCADAILPTYAHHGDAGMDLYAAESTIIAPRSRALVHTGLAAVIPPVHELQVRPRSGMACNRGLVAAFGTVDEGYRGEIGVTLYNHTSVVCQIQKGERVAQLVLAPVVRAQIEEVLELSADTERGTDGFGSTGR